MKQFNFLGKFRVDDPLCYNYINRVIDDEVAYIECIKNIYI